ncbi:hypothetical protein DPMN_121482, partial [Dreissena polymorpha]
IPGIHQNHVDIESSFNTEMRQRVKTLQSACKQLRANGSDFFSIEKSKLGHIVVDDKYQVMYCYVPKVACTNLKRVFLLLTGMMNVTDPLQLKSADVHGVHDKYLKYLNTVPSSGIAYRLKHYKKVIFVREPLERLLSAYRNKFLQNGNEYFKDRFGRKIIKQYRNNASAMSLEKGHDVRFEEFVEYFVDPKTQGQQYNEHWAPFFDLCHPCHMKYNFIGKYETLDDDVNGLLRILNVHNQIRFPDRGDNYKTLKTEDMLWKFYKSLDPVAVAKMVDIYSNDYSLFGYDLPPVAQKKLAKI